MAEFLIKTSSWYTPLPAGHKRIGISRYAPRGMKAGYRMLRELAPGDWFKTAWPDEYHRRYFAEILGHLDPRNTLVKIWEMVDDEVPVLCCFEPPNDPEKWCHRGYVSAWLDDTLGLKVTELGLEHEGWGWSHPKLPKTQRVLPAQQGAGAMFAAMEGRR